MKQCIYCNTGLSDFTSNIFDDLVPHFYCTGCKAHYYKERWYTAKQWFDYVNA